MPAKPQPMAGQSDVADDLIAELAKLMAQDAQGDGSSASSSPLYPVRIPGEAQQAKSTLDFVRAYTNSGAEQPSSAAPALAPKADIPRIPAFAPKPDEEPLEPFSFDFDFGASKRAPAEPVAAPVAAAPQPTAAPAPVMAAPASAPVEQPVSAAPAAELDDHDSIADLIAAELAVEPRPAPVVAPVAMPVAPPLAATPEPASEPIAEQRQPQPAPGWTPTTVAANLGGQQRPARPALRAVNLQPVARSEQDRFKVPPVFGLGTTPARSAETIVPVAEAPCAPEPAFSAPVEPPAPARLVAPEPMIASVAPQADDSALGLDPIDEIESLIGRAMRVEFDKPEPSIAPVPTQAPAPAPVQERPAPSPALRSLATPTIPTTRPALSAADEAVMAAAQATGAQVGWVEAPEVSEPVTRRRAERESRPVGRGITRAVAGPLVAVTLLLAAGFGLYWVLGLGGRDTSGAVPLLTADATPVKQVAPAATADTAATQQSVVFNEIDGVVPGAEEQLVSRDQSDVNEVTQVASTPPADVSEEGLANRKVRTVTVRPDGTIVSGEDSVAGSAILPVDRPNVPAVPGAETASPELLAAVDANTATPAPAAAAQAPTAPVVTPVQPGATVPVVDLAGNPVAGKTTVVPLMRPAGLAASAAATAPTPVTAVVDPVNALIDNAAAQTPATAPIAAATEQPVTVPGATEVAALGNDAPAYVQLASQRSEAEARQTAQALVTRYGPLFGGANMEVQRVDLGAKGVFYRVRVPATSLDQANNICVNVKAAGGDCFTM